MVNVGIVGLGPRWETQYLPVLMKLRSRIRVRAVYDAVTTRAEQVAAELKADVSPGIVTLLERVDVQAVLLLDSAWYGSAVFHLIAERKKPVYLANYIDSSLERLEKTHETALAEGTTLMPEFGRRYTPASCRLQELIATHLGPPCKIVADVVLPSSPSEVSSSEHLSVTDFLVGWYDWCRYIVRSTPTIIEAQNIETASDSGKSGHTGQLIRIQYGLGRDETIHPTAELRLQIPLPSEEHNSSTGTVNQTCSVRQEVFCKSGSAILEEAFSVTWQNRTETFSESLSAERSETEVMLNHFCRRVVGGLIPVPDINDICRGLRLVHAAKRSLTTGQPIHLDE